MDLEIENHLTEIIPGLVVLDINVKSKKSTDNAEYAKYTVKFTVRASSAIYPLSNLA